MNADKKLLSVLSAFICVHLRPISCWLPSGSAESPSTRPAESAESTRPSPGARIELGLLVRRQDLIKRRVGLRFNRGLLRIEPADRSRDLIDRGRAVTLHRVAQALA